MIDRKTFFDRVRAEPFGGFLSGSQVTGLSNILDEAERRGVGDPRFLAYRLATVFHETGKAMIPVREAGGEAYLKAKPYYPWVGMGLVQVTWEANGKKFGATKPEDLMSWSVALRALFDGMDQGVFTGRKLATYFSATVDDPVGARHIINGSDRAALIAGYHAQFLAAIKAGMAAEPVLIGSQNPAPALVVPPIAPGPDPAIKLPVLQPGTMLVHGSEWGGRPWPPLQPSETISTRPAPRRSFWAGLVAAFTPKSKTET